MTYLIYIPDETLPEAQAALAQAGVSFDPAKDALLLNADADIDHACAASDVPDIIYALNAHIRADGGTAQLNNDPAARTAAQDRSLMSIGHELIIWSGKRAIDGAALYEHGGPLRLIRSSHPDLLPLLEETP